MLRILCELGPKMKSTHHNGFGVAAERVLQESGELGVPVGDVSTLPVHQGRDNVPQGGQRQVDLCCFLQALSRRPGLRLPLRPLTKRGTQLCSGANLHMQV